MNGFAKIGPAVHAYRTLSEEAEKAGKSKLIFFSKEADPSKVPCPVAGPDNVGNVNKLAVIHLLEACSDGRVKGSIITRDAHKKYDLACCVHLPPAERIPLEQARHFTTAPEASTCYYCNFKKAIDPHYTPTSENEEAEPPPLV